MTNDSRNDVLEQEIEEAGINQEARESAKDDFEIPEKFREKSAEEIVKHYLELEKAYGRQANTVGQLRKSVDQLLEFKQPSESQAKAPPKPLSVDDIYDNPDDAVRRVVREESSGDLEAIRTELAETRKQLTLKDFESRHPDWKETVQSPEFANWVHEKPYRQKLAAHADQYDLDAAEEMFDMFKDTQGRKKTQDKTERDNQLRKAGLESGAASPPPMTQTYRRFELLDKRIRANQGDRNAALWLSENSASIQRAYEEGRVVD